LLTDVVDVTVTAIHRDYFFGLFWISLDASKYEQLVEWISLDASKYE